MTSLEGDLAAARTAARELSAAVDSLIRSHPHTVDLRRLAEDVRRLRADLALIAEADEPIDTRPGGHDTEYDPRQFGDGAFEDVRPGRG